MGLEAQRCTRMRSFRAGTTVCRDIGRTRTPRRSEELLPSSTARRKKRSLYCNELIGSYNEVVEALRRSLSALSPSLARRCSLSFLPHNDNLQQCMEPRSRPSPYRPVSPQGREGDWTSSASRKATATPEQHEEQQQLPQIPHHQYEERVEHQQGHYYRPMPNLPPLNSASQQLDGPHFAASSSSNGWGSQGYHSTSQNSHNGYGSGYSSTSWSLASGASQTPGESQSQFGWNPRYMDSNGSNGEYQGAECANVTETDTLGDPSQVLPLTSTFLLVHLLLLRVTIRGRIVTRMGSTRWLPRRRPTRTPTSSHLRRARPSLTASLSLERKRAIPTTRKFQHTARFSPLATKPTRPTLTRRTLILGLPPRKLRRVRKPRDPRPAARDRLAPSSAILGTSTSPSIRGSIHQKRLLLISPTFPPSPPPTPSLIPTSTPLAPPLGPPAQRAPSRPSPPTRLIVPRSLRNLNTLMPRSWPPTTAFVWPISTRRKPRVVTPRPSPGRCRPRRSRRRLVKRLSSTLTVDSAECLSLGSLCVEEERLPVDDTRAPSTALHAFLCRLARLPLHQ